MIDRAPTFKIETKECPLIACKEGCLCNGSKFFNVSTLNDITSLADKKEVPYLFLNLDDLREDDKVGVLQQLAEYNLPARYLTTSAIAPVQERILSLNLFNIVVFKHCENVTEDELLSIYNLKEHGLFVIAEFTVTTDIKLIDVMEVIESCKINIGHIRVVFDEVPSSLASKHVSNLLTFLDTKLITLSVCGMSLKENCFGIPLKKSVSVGGNFSFKDGCLGQCLTCGVCEGKGMI